VHEFFANKLDAGNPELFQFLKAFSQIFGV
jgi:hypothetical protein